ncbi:hypothetical protein [Priestia aryabhattai]|uniref:Uncharacterized protein n=1 Tax=Priestia aryabhattai TaxID=412384 RepID=A0ABD7X2D6_PRIAR|nr:hypothetical protein [Priestia aryabhattai]WEA46746.1 hypothetical protein PWO00_12525 [Priestia aryabhattai]
MKNVLKSKKVWLFAGPAIGAVVVGTSCFYIGKAVQDDIYSTNIDKEIVTYNQLVDEYNKINDKRNQYIDDIEDLEDEVSEKKKEVKEIKDAMAHKDELNTKIDTLEAKVQERASTVSDLDSEIKSKRSELLKLTANVVEKEDEPKQFSAGQYFVGQDFPEGRYKAVPVGEGSNFQVFDTDTGEAVVNTILGHDKYSESEFVFYAQDGQYMETQARVKLIAVE